jgi:hypothetical protein
MAAGAHALSVDNSYVAAATLDSHAVALRAPSLALYCPWGGSTGEGWMRLILDRSGFSYQRLRNHDFRALANRMDGGAVLRRSYDLIVLPPISPEILSSGRKEARGPSLTHATWPESYQGGLDDCSGAKLLGQYVRAGGTLIAMGCATRWVTHALGLPVDPELELLSADQFEAPGAQLRIELDPTQPLAWGMPASIAVVFDEGEAFRPRAYTERIEVPALYAREDLLVAGYLRGESHLAGRPALVDLPLEKGRVVLFGFSPLHRAQSEVSFKLFFNALLRALPSAETRG